MEENQSTTKFVSRYLIIVCTIAILGIFLLFICNFNWFKESALDNSDLMKNMEYRIYIYNIHFSNLKRLFGIISGISLSFLGLGICFHTISKSTKVELNKIGNMVSYSPGLIALFLGTVLIILSISIKDTVEIVIPGKETQTNQPK